MSRTPRRKETPAPERSAAQETRERLVQAAYELIAEHGLAGLKVLDIAARAQANVALINYHFGNRDGLIGEVIRREGEQIAQARSRRLATLLEAAGAALPDPKAVLHCWVDPWVENVEHPRNREVMQLLLHVVFAADVAPERKERLLERTVAVTSQFLDVLGRCYKDVPRERMAWRMLCAIGASYLVLGQKSPVGWTQLASGQAGVPPKMADAADELVAFILGGFAAPMGPP